jgi:6-phosphogluconolactonase
VTTVPSALAAALARGPVPDVPSAFARVVHEAFAARPGPGFSLVLSGGATARDCYERLAADPGPVDWSVVSVYLGDERLVPADHPDANQRLVREALLDRVPPVAAFHPMPTEGDPDRCAAAYGLVVARALEGGGLDLVHLGVVPDGHTASLFAGSAALADPADRLVLATVDPAGRNPHPRLTLTLPAIDRGRQAVFTVAGGSKAPIVAALARGEDLPAARVRAAALWLIDQAAFGPVPDAGPPVSRTSAQEAPSP